MPAWCLQDAPPLGDRVAVVTGANSGIGFETARALAGGGAHVMLACRDPQRGRDAVDAISASVPGASLELVGVDLAELESVRDAAAEIQSRHRHIDVLVNNAGVAWPRQEDDGTLDRQFAVNHLGHFAFTARLAPALCRSPGARVVTVTSLGHHLGRLSLDSLHARPRHPALAYGRSKLANLMFAFELQRRLHRAGSGCASLAAHPGGAHTNLIREGFVLGPATLRRVAQFQSAALGALCVLRAAVDPAARGGQVYGPAGPLQLRGSPVPVRTSRCSKDQPAAQELWRVSEQLSGVRFAIPPSDDGTVTDG